MKFKIITDEECLKILYDEKGNNNQTYVIRIVDLPDIRPDNEINYSEWIMQIHDYMWVNRKMLYALAKKIIELHPSNKIDWINTFEVVERSYFFEREAKKAYIKGLFECIKFNLILASNQQIQAKISKLIIKKLRNLKILQ